MSATPLLRTAASEMPGRGSGRTAFHCALCGKQHVVPSLAWLCELAHLEDDQEIVAA